jgi:hypothetical protein
MIILKFRENYNRFHAGETHGLDDALAEKILKLSTRRGAPIADKVGEQKPTKEPKTAKPEPEAREATASSTVGGRFDSVAMSGPAAAMPGADKPKEDAPKPRKRRARKKPTAE